MGCSTSPMQPGPEGMPYQFRSHILRFPMAPGLPTSSLALPGLCVSTHSCPLAAGTALLLLGPAAMPGSGLGMAEAALPAGPAEFVVNVDLNWLAECFIWTRFSCCVHVMLEGG